MVQKPSVGRLVHYVSYGTPGGEFTKACRSATVTEVSPTNPDLVGLAVLNPTGLFFHPLAAGGSSYDEGTETPGAPDCPDREHHGDRFVYCACGWLPPTKAGGTWHWPERV